MERLWIRFFGSDMGWYCGRNSPNSYLWHDGTWHPKTNEGLGEDFLPHQGYFSTRREIVTLLNKLYGRGAYELVDSDPQDPLDDLCDLVEEACDG